HVGKDQQVRNPPVVTNTSRNKSDKHFKLPVRFSDIDGYLHINNGYVPTVLSMSAPCICIRGARGIFPQLGLSLPTLILISVSRLFFLMKLRLMSVSSVWPGPPSPINM